MEFAKYLYVIVTIFVTVTTTSQAEDVENNAVKHLENDKWFLRKLAEAYNASLRAYHHDPHEVINELNYHVHRYIIFYVF